MKKLKFRYNILIGAYFCVLITSLWPNNIYLLFLFSVLCWGILPIKKWWDAISIGLLFFSLFYAIMEWMNDEIGSGFIFLSHLVAPVAFYRFGRWVMTVFRDNTCRLRFLFISILCYMLPLFLLTLQDIILVGIINETRVMLGDLGDDNTLAATLYGLMSSVGIGCIAALFMKGENFLFRIGYIILALLSMMVVIHLINRTGIIIFFACIIAAFSISTKMKFSKIIPAIFLLCLLTFIILKTGLISTDVIDAYANRENSSTASSTEFGGRSVIWADAISKLFTHPFGWERVRYAHNLWLDIARISGWLALFPFVIVSFVFFKNILKILRRKLGGFEILIVTILVSMFLNSCVEPVIDGSMLFFSLLLMFNGIAKTLSSETIQICR